MNWRRWIPESWLKPIPDGEQNPLNTAILRALLRGLIVITILWTAGWLGHSAWEILVSGWRFE